MEDIRNLFDALKLATERTEVIKREIETKDTGDAALDDLQTRLQAALKDEETTKETIFLQMAELSAKPAENTLQQPTSRSRILLSGKSTPLSCQKSANINTVITSYLGNPDSCAS